MDFKTEFFTRDKEGHFTMREEQILQEDTKSKMCICPIRKFQIHRAKIDRVKGRQTIPQS